MPLSDAGGGTTSVRVSPEPVVSFVVLCYRFERFIGECIESILSLETTVPFEVIVVDDASPDRSLDVIRSFDDRRIRVIAHEKNEGHARTVTDGFEASRGRYIARIDGDDRYRPGFLSNTLPVFEQYPSVGLVYGDARMIGDQGQLYESSSDRVHGGRTFVGNEFVELLASNFVCAPTIIARAECWKQTLPPPTHLSFHDWYFTLSIARHFDFAFLPVPLADYRIHSGNMHAATARDGSEERSVIWMLDRVFETREEDDRLERRKRSARSFIYASHYLDFAEKYFGTQQRGEARRCYLTALRASPGTFLRRRAALRRLLATQLPTAAYEGLKTVLKRKIS